MSQKKSIVILALFFCLLLLSSCTNPLSEKNYSVSGNIVDNSGNGIPEVTLTFSGGISGSVKTDAAGHWQMDAVNGTVTITPTKVSWRFEPQFATVTKASDNINFTGTFSQEDELQSRVISFFEVYENEDLEDFLSYFDYSRYEYTREEFSSLMTSNFESTDYDFEIKSFKSIQIDNNFAMVDILVDCFFSKGDETTERTVVFELSWAEVDSVWLLYNLAYYNETTYPEKDAINAFIEKFVLEAANENLTELATLINPNYNYNNRDYDDLLAEIQYYSEIIDINTYEIDYISFHLYAETSATLNMDILVNMTIDEVEYDTLLTLYFDLIKENDSWLLNKIKDIYYPEYYS